MLVADIHTHAITPTVFLFLVRSLPLAAHCCSDLNPPFDAPISLNSRSCCGYFAPLSFLNPDVAISHDRFPFPILALCLFIIVETP